MHKKVGLTNLLKIISLNHFGKLIVLPDGLLGVRILFSKPRMVESHLLKKKGVVVQMNTNLKKIIPINLILPQLSDMNFQNLVL
jgi:hypothetical protein